MPAVRNDAELVGRALALLPEVATVVAIGDPPMTTDDFALYAEKVPGLYLKLGVRAPGSTDWPALHTRLFDVDETCLPTGIAALSSLVRDALTR
jgi:metal-dependent amidase/aminoacylase/carboxypeptidase family protein